MITNPNWLKAKVKAYFHQISLECIEEIAAYIEDNDIEKIDCDTRLIVKEILSDEIEDEEFSDFAIDNLEELLSYIVKGNLNIRTHRNITGEMWFGGGGRMKTKMYSPTVYLSTKIMQLRVYYKKEL